MIHIVVCLLTWSCNSGTGISVLRAGSGPLLIAILLSGGHTCVTLEGAAFADRARESTWLETKHAYTQVGAARHTQVPNLYFNQASSPYTLFVHNIYV